VSADYNALVRAINKNLTEWQEARRTGAVPQHEPPDMTPSHMLADWLQENGVPGAHVVSRHAHTPLPTSTATGRRISLWAGAHPVNMEPVNLVTGDRRPEGADLWDWIAAQPKDHPLGQVLLHSRGGNGVLVQTMHRGEDGGDRVGHLAHAGTKDELRALLADMQPHVRQALLTTHDASAQTMLVRSLRGKGAKSPTKLAAIEPSNRPQGTVLVKVPNPGPPTPPPAQSNPAPATDKKSAPASGPAFILPQ